jgi:hypothetical protein
MYQLNCGHRIRVLFMMYGVYWYCQMKKNEWLWKFGKRNNYENFEKRGGGSREKGGGGNEIHAPCACEQSQPVLAQLHQSANIRISDFTFTDI